MRHILFGLIVLFGGTMLMHGMMVEGAWGHSMLVESEHLPTTADGSHIDPSQLQASVFRGSNPKTTQTVIIKTQEAYTPLLSAKNDDTNANDAVLGEKLLNSATPRRIVRQSPKPSLSGLFLEDQVGASKRENVQSAQSQNAEKQGDISYSEAIGGQPVVQLRSAKTPRPTRAQVAYDPIKQEEKVVAALPTGRAVFAPWQQEMPTFKRVDAVPDLVIPQDIIDTVLSHEATRGFGAMSAPAMDLIPHTLHQPNLRAQGIQQLIGVGVSDFVGSDWGRTENIKQSMAALNGSVIPRGGQLSFNEHVGPIRLNTGYQEAKVILGGVAVDGVGGGVCQSSTTLFRAGLSAGLPITQWRHHSFPVGYYGPVQGLDATIYPGQQDLIFTNDTPGDILIRTEIIGTKALVFVYGTNDRDVTVQNEYVRGSIWSGLKTGWNREVESHAGGTTYDTLTGSYKVPK